MESNSIEDENLFNVLIFICFTIPSLPRMHLKNLPLERLYNKIVVFLLLSVKNLVMFKIDIAYFCYNIIGRRIYSLSRMHQN